MRVTHIKSDDFCFTCGKEIDKAYQINLGTSATEFDLCDKCIKKLHKQIGKTLNGGDAK